MRYLYEFVELELDPAKCRGCRLCIEVCPHGVFGFATGKAIILDKRDCMECGACAKNCRFGAIKAKSGVGCASAIISGMIRGGEPSCGGAGSSCSCGGGVKEIPVKGSSGPTCC
jgi:NAD-dependent dihydropyrimidine dehydrogenase PreA subunit